MQYYIEIKNISSELTDMNMTEVNKRHFIKAKLGSDKHTADFLLTALVAATKKGTTSIPSSVKQNLDVRTTDY